MNPRVLIAIACFVSLLFGIILWRKMSEARFVYSGPQHPSIRSLENGLTLQDFVEWEKVGTRAIPILLEAMEKRPGPLAIAYSNSWSRMPPQIKSNLLPPVDDSKIRAAALALLADPKNGTNVPLAALARALQDPSRDVRLNALACLGHGPLPILGKEKEQILPQIIAASNDPDMMVRGSAVSCLKFYKEAHDQVVPILARALADKYGYVRIRAAMAFYHLDPVAAEKAGALSVAVDCLQMNGNGRDDGRYLAYDFLQKVGKLPSDALK